LPKDFPRSFNRNSFEAKHKSKCPELITTSQPIVNRGFFDKKKMALPFNADVFIGKLLKWIIKTDLPFSIVDNEHFTDILEYLKKDVSVNSRRTIMRRLEELYSQRKGELIARLNQFNSKYSITCDVWTSKNQLSFFGFTIHYIDDDWKMQDGLIAFKHLEGEHDGPSLASAMISVLEDLQIADRLLGVTADNASNNITMMACLEKYYTAHYPAAGFSVTWNQVECMAHVINLAAQQILKNFKQPVDSDTYEPECDSNDAVVTAVSRLSFLVRKIRRSPKLRFVEFRSFVTDRRLMKKVCDEKKGPFLVPIIDVKTRWNSTYDMLLRAVSLKETISDTIYAHKDNALIKLLLTDSDWDCIDSLLIILQPFKEVTLLCSRGSESLTVVDVLPLYNYCTEMLSEHAKTVSEQDDLYSGIVLALDKLNHYYDNISPMVGITLLLNPSKLKKEFLSDFLSWKQDWVDTVMDHFSSSFDYYKRRIVSSSSSSAPPAVMSESSGFDEYRKRKRTLTVPASIESESVRYFSAPAVQDGTDILLFWKANAVNFPVMAAMAKDYLTVQASSVASERAFSSGTDLVTSDRCSLGGRTIEMTQFLKFNL